MDNDVLKSKRADVLNSERTKSSLGVLEACKWQTPLSTWHPPPPPPHR